jgi:hypothetical protein
MSMSDIEIHSGVAVGSCVMIEDHEMVYAGPLGNAPEPEGKIVLLHPADFARLAADHGEGVRH